VDLSLLTETDWDQFKAQFSGAHAFLLDKSLWREWLHLRNKGNRNDYEAKRFDELADLFCKRIDGLKEMSEKADACYDAKWPMC
jgi:hypothetical protein